MKVPGDTDELFQQWISGALSKMEKKDVTIEFVSGVDDLHPARAQHGIVWML